jgi:hypothetical protein
VNPIVEAINPDHHTNNQFPKGKQKIKAITLSEESMFSKSKLILVVRVGNPSCWQAGDKTFALWLSKGKKYFKS